MTHTLADMTPEEQDLRVGTWCEDPDGDLVILDRVYELRVDGQVAVSVFHPPSGDRLRYLAPELTPRLDLPRAWTPSGEPVPGEWEESPSSEHHHRWCARWEQKPDGVALDMKDCYGETI